MNQKHTLPRRKSALLWTLLALACISVLHAEPTCNTFYNSMPGWVGGYGAVCWGTGPHCTECYGNGTVCVDGQFGDTCREYPVFKN